MQPVEKKKARSLRHGRLWLLLGVLALLAGGIAACVLLARQTEEELPQRVMEGGQLYACDTADVMGLRITLRSGDSWEMTRLEDDSFAVDGEAGYQIESQTLEQLLSAVATVTYEDILTEDWSAYAEHMADFGLETPRIVAEATYRDGTSLTMRIGDTYALEESGWCYMIIDGDSCLYALDTGTADNLAVSKATLHPVTQPTLHKVRFDRIVFTDENGDQICWELQGDIGTDAEDRWMLVSPMAYPADGEQMGNLRTNLANLRLGAYVGEATADNLTEYGFDAPRFRIEIHMAEGSIGTTDDDGVYGITDWPEETFTLTVGSAKNDSVDYILVDEAIYVTSHYSLATFMDMDPVSTLTRYTVPVALGNLAEMTVTSDGRTQTYAVTRTEQVQENNELVYDTDGNIVYDHTCTLDGREISYTSFEAAYNSLLMVTISGLLPDGWTTEAEPHTVYTFTQYDGTVHTVTLTDCDAFHDAVTLDGMSLFYLIKGGMTFSVE
ncbi:MAG: DUF4340 domain-containing protein [Aristaeellaceae bacterium]